MEFRTFCDNKGCMKENRPVVDKETLIAYCTECNKPMNNISIFMRRQMVSYNQVKTNVKKKVAWSVHCPNCSKDNAPDIDLKDQLICVECKTPLTNLTKPFAQMILTNLKARRRNNDL